MASELGFEQTSTGHRATDAQVQWWKARDTCPACGAVCSPGETIEGRHYYHHRCTEPLFPPEDTYWTRGVHSA